jgi:hypothetical protein
VAVWEEAAALTRITGEEKLECLDSVQGSGRSVRHSSLFIIRGEARAKENIYRWVSV